MKPEIKVSDWVKCVNSDSCNFIEKDHIYNVSVETKFDLKVRIRDYYYSKTRFEVATMDEVLAYAKTFLNKLVDYDLNTFTPSQIIVRHDFAKTEVCLSNYVLEIPLYRCELANSSIEVNGVGDYHAIVHKDYVEVGCQKITKEKVEEIMNAFQTLNS